MIAGAYLKTKASCAVNKTDHHPSRLKSSCIVQYLPLKMGEFCKNGNFEADQLEDKSSNTKRLVITTWSEGAAETSSIGEG